VSRFLAVDIGGTKLVVGIVDDAGTVVSRRQCATVADDPWPRLGAMIDDTVREAAGDHDRLVACGVGCGGPMLAGGEAVSPLNIPGWRGFPLRRAVAAASGLATYVDNDAKALALGEGWCGAAAGEANYLAMVVSTGVGGGIVLDGRLLDGAGGNAGHIGHVNVVTDGRDCACGSFGCLEAEASGLSIAAITGKPAAEADEATKVRTGVLVGRAVADVCALLDLRLAVVAGSVALGFGEPFFRAAQEELDRRCRIEFAAGATIRPAGLGSAGPLVGAAAVARRALGTP
jgi:glucokinase